MNWSAPETDDARLHEVLAHWPAHLRAEMDRLRAFIHETGARLDLGPIEESVKWGQLSLVPKRPRTGTPMRIGTVRGRPDRYGLYFVCHTHLVESFENQFGGLFTYEGGRALTFEPGPPWPEPELRACLHQALTYFKRPPGLELVLRK